VETDRAYLLRRLLRAMAWMFVDVNPDPSASVVLAGKGRSGTTWMADLINHNNDYRIIFEPFNPDRVAMCRHFGRRKYIRENSRDPRFLAPVEAIVTGRFRSAWSDAKNMRLFLAKRRLIKTVRATLFLRWLKSCYPTVPIVLALRHPCAVASSALKLGWTPAIPDMLAQEDLVEDFLAPYLDLILGARDDFERHVFAWCIEYYVVLRQFRIGEIYLLFWENLYDQPDWELEQVFDFLGERYEGHSGASLRKASSTTSKETRESIASGRDLLELWRAEVPREQVKRCLQILGVFGLDQIYSDDLRPHVAGARALLKRNERCAR
jgi:hypothetical protein